MKKRILWLCTYSDARKLAHIDCWPNEARPYGSWIPDLLRGFYNDAEYEIHVVSATDRQKKAIVEWTEDGVHYHSYQKGLPFVGYSNVKLDSVFDYLFEKIRIRKIVRRVRPDIIQLFGAENHEYSAVIPRLAKKYPLITMIQGFINRQKGKSMGRSFWVDLQIKRRCATEISVLRISRNFLAEPDAIAYARTLGCRNFRAHTFYLPINELLVEKILSKHVDKSIDVLFLARISKLKGIADFVCIVNMLKREHPCLRCVVAGQGMGKDEFELLCDQEGVSRSAVEFVGVLPTQEDVYGMECQAKVFLVPTYNDSFPTTIRECMMLQTAVVAYRTGGIPYANADDAQENICLVDQGDVRNMADRTLKLLSDERLRNELATRGQRRALEMFSLSANVTVTKNAYKEVLTGA